MRVITVTPLPFQLLMDCLDMRSVRRMRGVHADMHVTPPNALAGGRYGADRVGRNCTVPVIPATGMARA